MSEDQSQMRRFCEGLNQSQWKSYSADHRSSMGMVRGVTFESRDFGFKGFLGVVLLASCSVYFGFQSNDLSYTVFVCQVSSPMNGANAYIMHSESRLCRSAVAPLRFVRSNGLFQHHTSHKRRHQGSR